MESLGAEIANFHPGNEMREFSERGLAEVDGKAQSGHRAALRGREFLFGGVEILHRDAKRARKAGLDCVRGFDADDVVLIDVFDQRLKRAELVAAALN